MLTDDRPTAVAARMHVLRGAHRHGRYMLNLDTDVVLLAPIEDLWAHFERFGRARLTTTTTTRHHHNNTTQLRPRGVTDSAGPIPSPSPRIPPAVTGPTHVVGMGAMEFAEAEGFRHFPKPQHDGNDDGINTGLSLFDLHRWRRSSSIYISGTARRRPTRHRRSGCTMHGMS